MAIRAGDSAVSMNRAAPPAAGLALVLFVTLQTDLGLFAGVHRAEGANQPRLFAPRLHMTAGRAVARLARLAAVDVRGKGLDVCLVAVFAQAVVIDHLRIFDLRQIDLQPPESPLVPSLIGFRPGGSKLSVGRFCRTARTATGCKPDHHNPQGEYAQQGSTSRDLDTPRNFHDFCPLSVASLGPQRSRCTPSKKVARSALAEQRFVRVTGSR